MEIILFIFFCCFFLANLILPWINLGHIRELRQEIDKLKKHLVVLSLIHKNSAETPIIKNLEDTNISSSNDVSHSTSSRGKSIQIDKDSTSNEPPPYSVKKPFIEKKAKISFEQQFGARLPVWIGGIALALAGFFMVKYSIETGLLSPAIRITIGIIFGIGLLYGAQLVRQRPKLANGIRISQALSGAGIADLYVCIFAASNFYHLMPNFLGLVFMAAITATAVMLSLRHGMPIALLGLIGGFLTPSLIDTQNLELPILLIYLYFVLSGLMVVIRKEGWWPLSILALMGTFIWVCLWLFGNDFVPNTSIWIGLFLISISATIVALSHSQYERDSRTHINFLTPSLLLNYLTCGGSLLFMGIIVLHGGFGWAEWGLFFLLSLGGITLAYFNQRLYGLVPLVSMAMNATILLLWQHYQTSDFVIPLMLFGTLYIASGYLLQLRSEKPLLWAVLTAATSISYYLIGYYQLRHIPSLADMPKFWEVLALVFFAFSLVIFRNIHSKVSEAYEEQQPLLATYAIMASTFLSLAMTIALPYEYLSVAFAAELFAISWINTQLAVKALRHIALILLCIFGFLLTPQILLLIQLTIYSLVEAKLNMNETIPIINWPLFQLGLPALFFALGSCLLRQQKDDRFVRALEISAITLLVVMGYYLARHAFHMDANILFVKASFFERNVLNNLLFLYSLGCLWVGKQFSRQAVSLSGLILTGITLFRIGYFDLLLYNPLWSAQAVGTYPIANALLLSYGLPTLWLWKALQLAPNLGKGKWAKYGYGSMLVLSFTWVSLNVRQLFHGTYLNDHKDSNTEIYSYSVAWLVFGIGLLLLGTLRNNKMIRVASLLVMILTVGKVFLYDASALEGLLRVFSFFGLGLSLMALSWFYTRFVFAKNETELQQK